MISIPRAPVGEQSSIGFQPVSNHQTASLFVSGRSGGILLEQEREPTLVEARYRLAPR